MRVLTILGCSVFTLYYPTVIEAIDSILECDLEYVDLPRKTPTRGEKKRRLRSRATVCEATRMIMDRCFAETLPSRQIARILNLSTSCVEKRRILYDERRAPPTTPRSGRSSLLSPCLLEEIESLCEHLKYPTVPEIVEYLSPEYRCSLSTCRKALKVLNYSYKKVISV